MGQSWRALFLTSSRCVFAAAIHFPQVFPVNHRFENVITKKENLVMNTFSQSVQLLLGLGAEPKELTFLQVSLRGIVVFIATVIMVRLASKRSLSDKTPFDTALMVIIASALARAVNGSAAFFATLGCGFVLVILHRILAAVADYSHGFGILIKGQPSVLVKNGRLLHKNMRMNHVSQHDLEEDMRLNASTEDLSTIKVARIERCGDISFIKTE